MTRGASASRSQEVTKETAEAFGLPKAAGALVNSVEKGGPAEKARRRSRRHHHQGGRHEVRTSIRAAADHHDDQARAAKVTLTVWRKGAQKDIAVTVAEIKEDRRAMHARAQAVRRRRRRPSPTAWASCCPISPTSRRRSSTARAAC